MGRPQAPKGAAWEAAPWPTGGRCTTDDGAHFDTEVGDRRRDDLVPQVTWGTSPEDVMPITGLRARSRPSIADDGQARARCERSLGLHGPDARQPMTEIAGRRRCSSAPAPTAASRICAPPRQSLQGRKVAAGVRALVVPGSGLVKEQAEAGGPGPRSSSTPAPNGASPAARCAWR